MSSPADDVPPLQFETAVPHERTGAPALESFGVTCRLCQQTVADEYFDVNGQQVCAGCRDVVLRESEPPRGSMPIVRAGLFGLAAAIAGAIVYYAVVAITDLEIGLVAIAIGYMVGYAILKGTMGRGGRRFQIMAVLLTYWAVGLAYLPLAMSQAAEPAEQSADAATDPEAAAPSSAAAPATEAPSSESELTLPTAIAYLLAFSVALPVLSVVGSLPGGLINAAIIGFGMHQAWRMTSAPTLTIAGPFRVGSSVPSTT